MSKLFNDEVDSTIYKVVHVLIECLFKFDHVSSHACLRYGYILIQLILLEECLRWEIVEVDLDQHKKLQYLLFVARVIRVAIFEGKTKLLPRLHLLIVEHEYSALHVRQLNAPAHWE